MARYAAFLRGINVGPHKQVSMPELRAVLEERGYTDVATLLRSGNVLLTSGRRGADKVAADIEQAIDDGFGMDVRVIVRALAELRAVVDDNPLPDATKEPAKYLVYFLSAEPAKARIDAIDHSAFAPEEVRFGDRVMYAWLPNGVADAKLGRYVSDKTLGVTTTARNWSTLLKMLDHG